MRKCSKERSVEIERARYGENRMRVCVENERNTASCLRDGFIDLFVFLFSFQTGQNFGANIVKEEAKCCCECELGFF